MPSKLIPTEIPELLTFRAFSERHRSFSQGSLRALRFNSTRRGHPGNGFARAFLKIGSRVLIDEAEFFAAIRELQGADK